MNYSKEFPVDQIIGSYKEDTAINKINLSLSPDKKAIDHFIKDLTNVLYGAYQEEQVLFKMILQVKEELSSLIMAANAYQIQPEEAQQLSGTFIMHLKDLRDVLNTDLMAAFEGDPAARSYEEVVLCYPGFKAITIHRIAHQLFLLGIPLLPRLMSEKAHSETGIDIHPAATIGSHFFMDHGTGIVIGETTVIGNNVKIYQGVTLGALSTHGGQKLKNIKRHPTIMDNVTIYSNASILGGETIIGEGVTIKGNSFITSSVYSSAIYPDYVI